MDILKINKDMTEMVIRRMIDGNPDKYICVDSLHKEYVSINGILYYRTQHNKLALCYIPSVIKGTVYLPDNVIDIDLWEKPAISRLIGLEVEIIAARKTIYSDTNSFWQCPITDICVPKIREIQEEAFCGSMIKQFTISNSIEIIDRAFQDCKELSSLYTQPVTVDNLFDNDSIDKILINSRAFENCTALKTVILKHTDHLIIGFETFAKCTNLQTIILRNIKNIPPHAFQHCPNLTTILLPEDCTVADDAFEDCVKSKITFLSDEELRNVVLEEKI
ncbi:MAG: leucine-rich repeat protein [Clostridia bacterium]|nr:leucine-rich repeat protein [Clostridia bacterium]